MESDGGIVWTDSSEELENSKDSKLADSENDQVDNDVDNDVDADIDEDDQWVAYSVQRADPLCYKFDNLLRRGLVDKNGILYKYLTDVVEIFYDRCHQYDSDVIEFFNSIRHLGGRRTVNFMRGPMHIGQGKRGSAQPKKTCKVNLGGPSETVCNKSQAGYTVKSGVIKPLSLAHLTLATNNDGRHITPLISSSIVCVIPCSLSCDGNAIKPSIEYDPRLKRCIGLNLDVDFVTKNPIVTPEFLNKHIVTKVSVTSVTTLDNEVSMPCATNYMPKGGKTGTAICDSLLSTIKILQVCEACVKRTVPTEHIIDNSIACKKSV